MNTSYYHIYLSGNNYQDIFYSNLDFIQIINRMALAAHETSTKILAYIFHQNHFHLLVRTADAGRFNHYFRMSIAHWFRRAYDVRGGVGMRRSGKHLVKSDEDLLDLLMYILRNEVRHGIATNPFEAPWSSINYYFKQQNGIVCREERKVIDHRFVSRYLPGGQTLPKDYTMSENGLIFPDTFLDIRYVEQLFASEANFKGMVSCPSRREMNVLMQQDRAQELRTAKVEHPLIKDAALIEFLKVVIKERFPAKNITSLSSAEKYELAAVARETYKRATYRQLSRILAIPVSTLQRNSR